jgi:hypothetical protein
MAQVQLVLLIKVLLAVQVGQMLQLMVTAVAVVVQVVWVKMEIRLLD